MPPAKNKPNILRGPGDYEVTSVVHNDTYPEIHPRKAELYGTSVFITGGSRGIGRAIALSFARAGTSHIAVGARSSLTTLAEEIKIASELTGSSQTHFLPVQMDVISPSSVAEAADEVKKEFEKLQILINNADIRGNYGLIAVSEPQE